MQTTILRLKLRMPSLDVTKVKRSINISTDNGHQKGHHEGSILPQVIVTILCCLLLLDFGMMISFSRMTTTVYEKMSVDVVHGSWLSITAYIMQAVGSCISGFTADVGGRKLSMLVTNIAIFSGWIVTGFCDSIELLYASNALMGLGMGLTMVPVLAYLAEISQTHLRNILIASTGTMPHIGCLLIYSLWPYVHWRKIAFASIAVPLLSFASIFWIPESPFWLMAKGQEDKAEAAMQWLRGLSTPSNEMGEVRQHVLSSRHEICILYSPEKYSPQLDNLGLDFSPEESTHNNALQSGCVIEYRSSVADSLQVKFLDSEEHSVHIAGKRQNSVKCLRGETLFPQIVISGYFFFTRLSGASGSEIFFTNVSHLLRLRMDNNWIMVSASLLGFVSITVFTFLLKKFGKRELALASIVACSFCNIILGTCVNALEMNTQTKCSEVSKTLNFTSSSSNALYLPDISRVQNNAEAATTTEDTEIVKSNRTFSDFNVSAVDGYNSTLTSDNTLQLSLTVTGIAVLAFISLLFFTYIGVYEIPWIYGAELFPVRTRGTSIGASAAVAYSASFISVQIYPYLVFSFGMNGTFWLHGFIGLIAFIFTHCLLPETDGKPIYETEMIFKKMLRKHAEKRARSKI